MLKVVSLPKKMVASALLCAELRKIEHFPCLDIIIFTLSGPRPFHKGRVTSFEL